MRCHICDKSLTEAEIQLTPDGKEFEPCSHCMEIALDAAYTGDFVREETEEGVLPTLDEDTYRSAFDCCDTGYEPELFLDINE